MNFIFVRFFASIFPGICPIFSPFNSKGDIRVELIRWFNKNIWNMNWWWPKLCQISTLSIRILRQPTSVLLSIGSTLKVFIHHLFTILCTFWIISYPASLSTGGVGNSRRMSLVKLAKQSIESMRQRESMKITTDPELSAKVWTLYDKFIYI